MVFYTHGGIKGSMGPERCGSGVPNGPCECPHSWFGEGRYFYSDLPFELWGCRPPKRGLLLLLLLPLPLMLLLLLLLLLPLLLLPLLLLLPPLLLLPLLPLPLPLPLPLLLLPPLLLLMAYGIYKWHGLWHIWHMPWHGLLCMA